MRILADENIPVVDAFFADQGSIRRLPGRAIDRAALAEVDVLLVRSVTEVSRAALAGSPVRFVGTCTIGTDHLDLDYFAEAGIAWSSAPGCNARGVVDYVLGCLLAMAEVRGADLAERTYGVVGAGQVGGRLVEVLRGLGWKVLVCDPPRQAREPDGEFVSLERLLAEADVISLHTPLNRDGEHPTATCWMNPAWPPCVPAPGWSTPAVARWSTTRPCAACSKAAPTWKWRWTSGKANRRPTPNWPRAA